MGRPDLAPDTLTIGGPLVSPLQDPEFFPEWKSGMVPWYFRLVWITEVMSCVSGARTAASPTKSALMS